MDSWYPIEYHESMEASTTIHRSRELARLTLRSLAARAGTSHPTIAAYEAGRKSPGVATLTRIVEAAGFALEVSLVPLAGPVDRRERGQELIEVLELAEQFPARHAPQLVAPVFGRG